MLFIASKTTTSPPAGCILKVISKSFLLYPDTVSSLDLPSPTSQLYMWNNCLLFSMPLLPPPSISDYNLSLNSNTFSIVFLVWTLIFKYFFLTSVNNTVILSILPSISVDPSTPSLLAQGVCLHKEADAWVTLDPKSRQESNKAKY